MSNAFIFALMIGFFIPTVALVVSIIFFFQGEVGLGVVLFLFWLIMSDSDNNED